MLPFGVIMPALRPAKHLPPGDNRTLQLRVRRAKELDILRDEYMGDELGPTVHIPGTDYEYRAYCTPEAYARAMTRMIMEIDYVKFKPTTDRYQDHQLHSTYNRIWGVLFSEHSTPKHKQEYLGTSAITTASKYYPHLPASTFYSSATPVSNSTDTDHRWTSGTDYDDPEFKGYSSGAWWNDDVLEPFSLEELKDLEDETPTAALPTTETTTEVTPASPEDSLMLNTDQLADCLSVSVVQVREFLASPMSEWKRQNNGKYEVPFTEFRDMARRFYEWQDARQKQQ